MSNTYSERLHKGKKYVVRITTRLLRNLGVDRNDLLILVTCSLPAFDRIMHVRYKRKKIIRHISRCDCRKTSHKFVHLVTFNRDDPDYQCAELNEVAFLGLAITVYTSHPLGEHKITNRVKSATN